MTRSRSRRFTSKVLQAPGAPPAGAKKQDPQPMIIPPEKLLTNQDVLLTQLGTTTNYSENKQAPEPPVPPPTNGQEPRQKPKTDVIKKVKQTTRRSKKAVINTPVEDTWTGAWATAIGPEQAPNPPPTDAKQGRGSKEAFCKSHQRPRKCPLLDQFGDD